MRDVSEQAPPSPRRAALAACAGNAVEWYDFAVYGALALTLGDVFFPTADPTTSLLGAFALYGTAFLFRPAGAVLFGRLGDRWGRRPVLLLAIALMTSATAAVALVPTYAAAGALAPALVLLLRAVQGLAGGGELGVAGTYLVEAAPRRSRARYGAGLPATSALGIALGMVVVGTVSALAGMERLVEGWWRLPFLVALPLGIVGLVMRRVLTHTEPLRQAAPVLRRRDDGPRRWRSDRGPLARGFTLIAAGALVFNVYFIYFPNRLAAEDEVDGGRVFLLTALMLCLGAVAALVIGAVSDGVGRRHVAVASTGVLAVVAPTMALLIDGSVALLVLAQALLGPAAAGVLNPAMVAEQFPAEHRSTDLGLTVGLATALVGGTGPFVATLLDQVTVGPRALAGYLGVVAVLALLALRGWRETAHEDLR